MGSSRYIGCKGSEFSFNITNLFSILPDGDPRDSPPYFLKVRLDFRVINQKKLVKYYQSLLDNHICTIVKTRVNGLISFGEVIANLGKVGS